MILSLILSCHTGRWRCVLEEYCETWWDTNFNFVQIVVAGAFFPNTIDNTEQCYFHFACSFWRCHKRSFPSQYHQNHWGTLIFCLFSSLAYDYGVGFVIDASCGPFGITCKDSIYIFFVLQCRHFDLGHHGWSQSYQCKLERSWRSSREVKQISRPSSWVLVGWRKSSGAVWLETTVSLVTIPRFHISPEAIVMLREQERMRSLILSLCSGG